MTKLSTGTSHSHRMTSFGNLFKKYRLRSEIETLAEFGDLLAEEGIIYENSLFTRWQNGERVPTDRKVLLAIITVFVKRRGIKLIEESNELLEVINQRSLNEIESNVIAKFLPLSNFQTLPMLPDVYVNREDYIKCATWDLINGQKVLLSGMAGTGKTMLALNIAHVLKNIFIDGIFWFRSDIKNLNIIVEELLRNFEGKISPNESTDKKIEYLQTLLEKKTALIIFDNIEEKLFESQEFNNFLSLKVSTIFTSIVEISDKRLNNYHVASFSCDEFLELAQKILAEPFVKLHKKQLLQLGKAMGYLPITSNILIKQIYKEPEFLAKFVSNELQFDLQIQGYIYEEKNLFNVLQLAFSKMSIDQQESLLVFACFNGTDFSIDALVSILNITKKVARRKIKDLLQSSFVEKSIKNRYRLHPVVKKFLSLKLSIEYYLRLSAFYVLVLDKYPKGSELYLEFLTQEYENISSLLVELFNAGQYKAVTQLWEFIGRYIFYTGRWSVILDLDRLIQKSYKECNDKLGLGFYLCEDLGRIYFYQGNIKNVFKTLESTSLLAAELNNNFLKGLILQKHGIINTLSGKYHEAERQLKETGLFVKRTSNEEEWLKTESYLGMLYVKKGEYKKGIQKLTATLKMSRDMNDITLVAFVSLYLGQAYLYTNNSVKSIEHFTLAITLSKKMNLKIGLALSLKGLGLAYMNTNKFTLGKKKLAQALKLTENLKMLSETNEIKQYLLGKNI